MLKITKNQGSIQVTADKSGFYPFDGTITFPLNSLFTATSANTDMITFKSTSNGDVQFVGNYKDITISGRSYDTKQKFLTAFSNLANQGSVDAYTKAETDAKIDAKQDKLTAGTGIKITKDETAGKTFINTKLEMGKGPYNSDGISIGRIARLASSGGIALGDESLSEHSGIAIGHKAMSNGQSTIVIGNNSSDQDGSSVSSGVVIGNAAHGGGAGVVIGAGTRGGSAGAVIGYNSTVDGNGYGYAIGDNVHISETTNMVPIAIGYGAEANETKPLAITILKIPGTTDSEGNPEMKYCDFIQGDANGKISLLKGDGTDERLVIQDEIAALKNAGGGTVDAYTKAETDTKLEAKQDKLTTGTGITITKDETAGTSTIATAVSLTDNGNGAYQVGSSIKMGAGIAIGTSATSPSDKSIAIGNSANINPDDIESVAVGYKANAAESYSVAVGSNTTASGSFNVCVGYRCAARWSSVAIGKEANAFSSSNVSIGSSAMVGSNSNDSIAIGNTANSTAYSCIAIGTTASSSAADCISIGRNASANSNNCIGIGHGSKATTDMPLVIKAGDDGNGTPLSMIQGASNGKISIPLGDGTASTMCLQDEIAALKAEIAALKGGASTGA